MKVRGWSTSVRDVFAVAGMSAGVLTVVFAGKSVGAWVLAVTGSVWLGTCAWVGTLLAGMLVFLAGFTWLLTDPRSYRHPDTEQPRPVRTRSLL